MRETTILRFYGTPLFLVLGSERLRVVSRWQGSEVEADFGTPKDK